MYIATRIVFLSSTETLVSDRPWFQAQYSIPEVDRDTAEETDHSHPTTWTVARSYVPNVRPMLDVLNTLYTSGYAIKFPIIPEIASRPSASETVLSGGCGIWRPGIAGIGPGRV